MARSRRPRRPRVAIGLAILASITLITLDYRGAAHGDIARLKSGASDAFSPVQRGVDAVTHPLGSFLAGAVHGSQLEQDNAKLRQEVSQYRQEALAGQATQNALRDIDRLNHLTWIPGIPTVTAEVSNLNPSNFAATVSLDKGTADGIDDGMPVVGGSGLVGLVIATSSHACTVRLITDVGSEVGVRYGPASTDIALIDGNGIGKSLTLSDVTPGAPLHKGEVLTTSGLANASYPPLIPVGTVTAVSSNPSSTEESVRVAPVSNLGQLDYVDVLQWPAVP